MTDKGRNVKLDIIYDLKDKGVSDKNIKWVSEEIDKLIKEQEEQIKKWR